MTEIIRNWTPKTEFIFITTVAFSGFVINSFIHLAPAESPIITNTHLWSIVLWEVPMLVALGGILHLRGWRLNDIGCNPSRRLTGWGLLLFLVSYPSSGVIAGIVSVFLPAAGPHLSSLAADNLSLPAITALSLVNPFYEEILVLGYVFVAVERMSDSSTALALSVLIRTSYHAYQGPAGAVGVLAMGLLFAYSFHKTRALWPMIVAHGIWDFYGLSR